MQSAVCIFLTTRKDRLLQFIGGGWVRQRCHVSYITGVSSWDWLPVGQGLLSLQQVRVEGGNDFISSVSSLSFLFLFLSCFSFISSTISSPFLWEMIQNDPKGWHVVKPQHNQSIIIFIPCHTIVAGYYGFMLVVSVSVCQLYVCLSIFRFRMITWVNINGFSPNLVCALILWRSGLGLLMGKFCQIFMKLSARDMPIFSFPDYNLSK